MNPKTIEVLIAAHTQVLSDLHGLKLPVTASMRVQNAINRLTWCVGYLEALKEKNDGEQP